MVLVTVYVPHTTCGIMINEGADPDVVRDIKYQLENINSISKRISAYGRKC